MRKVIEVSVGAAQADFERLMSAAKTCLYTSLPLSKQASQVCPMIETLLSTSKPAVTVVNQRRTSQWHKLELAPLRG